MSENRKPSKNKEKQPAAVLPAGGDDIGKLGQPLPMTPLPEMPKASASSSTESVPNMSVPSKTRCKHRIERRIRVLQEWMGLIYRPGDQVPYSGLYQSDHSKRCRCPGFNELRFATGDVFPNCFECGSAVRFRVLRRLEDDEAGDLPSDSHPDSSG